MTTTQTDSTGMDTAPKPKFFREKIGHTEYSLREEKLDVFDDVMLWDGNPRLEVEIAEGTVATEEELQAKLRLSKGYDVLARSIQEIGQMEPIYAWKKEGMAKFLVFEGSTRVTALREHSIKNKGKPNEARFRKVTAKILPEEFSEEERVILLARIHVRGSGVRAWGRYIEAKFIHDHVTPQNGKKPVTSVSELANHMGKSISWVSRLKDAYEFARRFVEHVDTEEAPRLAAEHFSTLEEISKATNFGAMVRDYGNAENDGLRAEIFDMVEADVFKEYRDARFIKQFHDDPEKWAQLKSHEKHIANKLANEAKAKTSSLPDKIESLPAQIERTLDRDPTALDEKALESLQKAVRQVAMRVVGVAEFRLHMKQFTEALGQASLSDVKAVTPGELEELREGIADFEERLAKHGCLKPPQ